MSGPNLMQMASSTAEGVGGSYLGTHSGSVNVTVTQGYSGDIVTNVTTDLTAISIAPKAIASKISEDDIVAKLADLIDKKNSKPSGGSTQKIFSEEMLADVKQDVLEIDLEKETNLSLDTDFLEKTDTRNIENEVTTILVENQEEIFLLAEALENGDYNNLKQVVVPKGVIKTIPPVIEAYVVEVGSEINTEVESQIEDPFNLTELSLSITPLETNYTNTSTSINYEANHAIASTISKAETSKEIFIDSVKGLENAIEEVVLNGTKETLILNEKVAELAPEITKLLDNADISYQVSELNSDNLKIDILNEEAQTIESRAVVTTPIQATQETFNNTSTELPKFKKEQLEALISNLEANVYSSAA